MRPPEGLVCDFFNVITSSIILLNDYPMMNKTIASDWIYQKTCRLARVCIQEPTWRFFNFISYSFYRRYWTIGEVVYLPVRHKWNNWHDKSLSSLWGMHLIFTYQLDLGAFQNPSEKKTSVAILHLIDRRSDRERNPTSQLKNTRIKIKIHNIVHVWGWYGGISKKKIEKFQ